MNKIKEFIKKLNLTIRELAEKSSVAASYISELENDCNSKKNPTKETMDKLAAALDTTVPRLFY